MSTTDNGLRAAVGTASKRDGPVMFEGKRHTTSWVKFEMPDNQRIVLAVKINGMPAHVMLDSGVGTSALSQELAMKLGLRATGSLNSYGFTGQVNSQISEGVQISIEEMTINTPRIAIFDLTKLPLFSPHPVVGLLGKDIFDNVIVDVDFENQQIAFRDATGREPFTGATEVGLGRGDFDRRTLSISIEKRPPIEALLDLGADRGLYLSPRYVAEQQVFEGKKTSTSVSIGVEGSGTTQVAVVDNLTAGGVTFRNVPIEVPSTWSFSVPAVVGFPVLRRLRITFDFPHDRLAMLPNRLAMNQPFRKDRAGLGVKRVDNTFHIMHISPSSPAEAAGLKVGDVIVGVNGKPLDDQYFRTRTREGSKPPGTVTEFTLSTGAVITITLADYF